MTRSRRAIVVFALLACYMVVSVVPVAAGTAAIASHTTASELSQGSVSNATVERSGQAAQVSSGTYGSSGLHRWAFDRGSGSTAYDSIGSADGSLGSGVSWASGRSGSSLAFSGSGGVSLPDGSFSTVTPTSSWTVSVWVRPSKSKGMEIIDMRDSYDFQLRWLGNNRVQIENYDGSTQNSVNSSVLSVGSWHHLSIAHAADGTTRIFVNGSLDTTGTLQTDAQIISNTPTIGSVSNGKIPFSGRIDDVRVFSSSLSPGLGGRLTDTPNTKLNSAMPYRWSMDAGQGSTLFGDNGLDGSLNSASWTGGVSRTGIHVGAGENASISHNSVFNSNSFTVSMWVKPDSLPTGHNRGLATYRKSNIRSPWDIMVDPSGHVVLNSNSQDNVWSSATSNKTLTVGSWQHVAVTYNESTKGASFYIDGSPAGSGTLSGSGARVNKSASPVVLGETPRATNGSLHGALDEFRFAPRVVSKSRIGYLYQHPSAERPINGSYSSASYSVSNSNRGWTNLSLKNASATVSWKTSSGTILNKSTVSTSGNHSLSWSPSSADSVHVDVQFNETDPDHTARLHGEGVSAETHAPSVSGLTPNQTTTAQSSNVELSANISDADFATAQGDTVSVKWFMDGVLKHTSSTSSAGTVSWSPTNQTAGTHTWHVELSDSYGNSVTSGTASFSVAANLYIRNESAPSKLVGNATVKVRMFVNETGTPNVYERSTSNGVVNMSGVPANKPFVVVASADNYTSRRIFVPSLYDTQTVYLLPSSAGTADTIFAIKDYTGNYPSESSVLLVQRSLNGSYQTVLGDYFGAAGQFPAKLALNKRHRLVLLNVNTGQSRVLGTYTPIASQKQTVTVAPSGTISRQPYGPTADVQPGVSVVPALNNTTLSITLRNESSSVSSWRIVANTSSVELWNATVSPGNVSHDFALANRGGQSLQVRVLATTANGTRVVETRTYTVQESLSNDATLLATLSRVTEVAAPGTAGALTTMLSMIVTVLAMVGLASRTRASGMVTGVTGVLVLGAFGAIGWVSFDLVFVAGVGVVTFGALRRGL